MPGTARIGPTDTNGFEGQMTTASAAPRAAATSGVADASVDPGEGDLEHIRRLVQPNEVVLEGEPAVRRPDPGPDGLVRHRQDRRRDAQRPPDPAADLRQPGALPQAPGPVDVEGQVAVAETEPRRLAEPGQDAGREEGLAGEAPAPLAVGEAGQRVEHGVVIRADEEAVELVVVRRVDDHRQLAGCEDLLQPVGEPGSSDPASEGDDPRHPAAPQASRAARTSPIRAIVSGSYGAGRRTTMVAKPRST